jgi:hypothetical protein
LIEYCSCAHQGPVAERCEKKEKSTGRKNIDRFSINTGPTLGALKAYCVVDSALLPPSPVLSATVGAQLPPLCSVALAVAAREPSSGALQKPDGVNAPPVPTESKVHVARFWP